MRKIRLAAEEGDAHVVLAWLAGGGGVDTRSQEYGSTTLLMGAAQGGQEAMVRLLLKRGASINLQNSNGATALMCAADSGHTTIVQVLLDAKADASLQGCTGSTALMFAELSKHTATAQVLRQHELPTAETAAPPGCPKPAAAQEELPQVVWVAAKDGNALVVAAWLDGGGGVDARSQECGGTSMLTVAAEGGHEAMVRMLLQRGASVNLRTVRASPH